MAGEVEGPGRIGRREIWDGRIVRLSLDTVRFPDGRTGELEFIRHRGAAAVVPFLDDPLDPDPRIVVLRQYRYAAGGVILEIPAGIVDPGDADWESCARRELEEETGHRTADLRYLAPIHTTPGFTDEVIHLFAAAALSEGRKDRDEDEYLEVETLRLSELLEGIRDGAITDAKTVAALQHVHAFRDQVWPQRRSAPPLSSS
ncbi:MAG: NUDIX hydrolase [Gemmatimonadales bacterium]|nr:MAG: NUDIX hydrolase [Gemmatimonadales bacterium]